MRKAGWLGLLLLVCSGTAVAGFNPLDTLITPGKLIQGHAKFEKECKQCHKPFKRSEQNDLCLSCHDHKLIANDVRKRKGYHGRLRGEACSHCHTDHKGRNKKIVIINERTFNHKWTDFPLRGKHASPRIKCKSCHKPGKKFRQAPGTCYACHRKDDKHKGRFGKSCDNCHNERDWKQVRFDHSKTDYPLIGKHRDAKCKSCHKNKDHKKTPKKCYSCHRKDDDHKGYFGSKCDSCHSPRGWDRSSFNHRQESGFALLGKHRRIKCTSCHKAPPKKQKMGETCYDCHRTDDVHKGKQGRRCEQCHDEQSWKNALFDHGLTGFPLLGKHASPKVKCKSCHKSKTFRLKSSRCVACHRRDDEHKGRLGAYCETCHIARSWKLWTFDHNKQTDFRLTGKHRGLKCTVCHTEPVKTVRLSGTCYDCHEQDDIHDGDFGRFCGRCHVTSSFRRIRNLPGMSR